MLIAMLIRPVAVLEFRLLDQLVINPLRGYLEGPWD
jgi:hypothetical protein